MIFAAFGQLITPQQWTKGRPPQQWRIQNYVCHVLEKKLSMARTWMKKKKEEDCSWSIKMVTVPLWSLWWRSMTKVIKLSCISCCCCGRQEIQLKNRWSDWERKPSNSRKDITWSRVNKSGEKWNRAVILLVFFVNILVFEKTSWFNLVESKRINPINLPFGDSFGFVSL